MASTWNFERTLADEIDLLTGRVASLSTTVTSYPNQNTQGPVDMPMMYPPHLPLTPPEYQQYSGNGMQLNQYQYAVGAPPPEKGVYEINIDQYGRKQPSSFVPVQGYHRQPQQQQKSYTGLPPPGITHPGGTFHPQYRHGAPQRRVEAPLSSETLYSRSSGNSSVSHTSNHSRQDSRRVEAAPPVEEKAIGGVSAHLDYDMEEMTDFVGIMAQQLVTMTQADGLTSQYRKFVYQILSSTRLPSSTILLGLVYLRERMAMPNMHGLKTDHVYRYLTIALLLASKFLDDNTFQNKSWSEVTSIPVLELNSMEKDWLREIRWNLHVDADGNKGFSQYKNMWETWRKQRVASKAALAPVDSNSGRPNSHVGYSPPNYLYPGHSGYTHSHSSAHSSAHSSIASERPILPPVQAPRQGQYHRWGPGPEYSPPSAPETGPTTPEDMYRWSATPYHLQQQQHQQANYSRLPPIVPTSNHHSWQAHQAFPLHAQGICNCPTCSHPVFMGNAYTQIPISA